MAGFDAGLSLGAAMIMQEVSDPYLHSQACGCC
jgi:hypothetical protein